MVVVLFFMETFSLPGSKSAHLNAVIRCREQTNKLPYISEYSFMFLHFG